MLGIIVLLASPAIPKIQLPLLGFHDTLLKPSSSPSVPEEAAQPQSITKPPPCFIADRVFFSEYDSLLQTYRWSIGQKSSSFCFIAPLNRSPRLLRRDETKLELFELFSFDFFFKSKFANKPNLQWVLHFDSNCIMGQWNIKNRTAHFILESNPLYCTSHLIP